MRLLTVYNTCGISGKENPWFYVDSLRSILGQTFYGESKDSHIALSACCMGEVAKEYVQGSMGDRISYNFIDEVLPLGVTFNDTVDQIVKQFGAFDGYLYVDSGISLWGQWQILSYLTYHHMDDNAITATSTSNDTGFEVWGIPFIPEPHTLPMGQAFNMHFQIFDESWRKAYGRILPDIFASNTSESVFTFMASGVGKKVVVHREVVVLHVLSMDGPSSGFKDVLMFPNHPSQKSFQQIYDEGKDLGYGWEGCDPQKRWVHNPGLYDGHKVKDEPGLRAFIKENLFVPESLFKYESIKRRFIPRGKS